MLSDALRAAGIALQQGAGAETAMMAAAMEEVLFRGYAFQAAAAFNAAVRQAEEVSQQKMGKLTAGLPPGMKLPF